MTELKTSNLIFDRENFLANFQGMEDLALYTIESFLSILPKLTAAIETAICIKNYSDLELSAHTLRGSLSVFYAESCKLLSWELEKMGKSHVMDGAENIFQALISDLRKLSNELQKLANIIRKK